MRFTCLAATLTLSFALYHAAANAHLQQQPPAKEVRDKPAAGSHTQPQDAGSGSDPKTDAAATDAGATNTPLVYAARDVTRKAVILAKPEPAYTKEARQNNISGTVILRAILSSSGEVKFITPVQRLPFGLTEQAIESASKIRFTPAERDGKPVSQYVRIEYNFNIFDYDKMAERVVTEVLFLPPEAKPLLSIIFSRYKAFPATTPMVFWQQLGFGLAQLGAVQQFEFQKLRINSLSGLTQEERDALEQIGAKANATAAEKKRVDELMKQAIRSLTEDELKQMQQLAMAALKAAVSAQGK